MAWCGMVSDVKAIKHDLFDCCRAGVQHDRSAEDARSNAHVAMSVSSVRQGVLSTVASAGSSTHSHRRASVPMYALRARLRRPVQSASSPADSRRSQEISLSELQQAVLSYVAAGQTSRRGVLSQQLAMARTC